MPFDTVVAQRLRHTQTGDRSIHLFQPLPEAVVQLGASAGIICSVHS